MESCTTLPPDWNEIPKFKSDTSKWICYFSSVTEDVYITVKKVLELDYKCQICFQKHQDGKIVNQPPPELKVLHF